jgi:hypothetical protein
MSISKLLIPLAVALMVAVPAGTARADAHWEGTGTAVIWDDAALSDAITFAMTGVALPESDWAYEGWLVSNDGSVKLSTGIMAVDGDGNINHSYTDADGQNLIHGYDKVVVTVEPIPDPDPGPSGVFAFSDNIPAAGMAHIRHLLTNSPPGTDKGILTNLKEQLDVAVLHANLAANQDTIEGIRQHLEHVINAIEGKDGPNYGDINGDGSVEDFGDGIGVLTHVADRKHGPFAAGAAADEEVIVAGAALVDSTGENVEDWVTLARDTALSNIVNASPSVQLAKIWLGPGAGSIVSSLEAARNGYDADNDGTIESIAGEAGADQVYVEAQKMATYTLNLGALPASAAPALTGPGIGLPSSVGDPVIPRLAQYGLIAALALLGTGGLLILGGRRLRGRA